MTLLSRLWFGPLTAAILFLGMVGLAFAVPGYNQVRQTVSEIGEVGSRAQIPFAITLCIVAACLLVFATALRQVSIGAGRPAWVAYVVGFMALPVAGVGIFAYPHQLHNVFGLAELVGYQAPLVLALTWRRAPDAKALVVFSWIMAVAVWAAIVLNLASLDRHGALGAVVKPVYGLVQRALFAIWFGWCAGLGVMLARRQPSTAS